MPGAPTPNRKLAQPTVGGDNAIWGGELNTGVALVVDSILGSVTSIGVAAGSNIVLTDAQQQAAVIRVTGNLNGNHARINFSQAGFWMLDNKTTSTGGDFVVVLNGPSGIQISVPRGACQQIYCDGSNLLYVNLPPTGTLTKLFGSALPSWIALSTTPPYVPCDGAQRPTASFPALSAYMSAIDPSWIVGPNFFVPDLRGRAQFDLDPTATHITANTFVPNGNTAGALGGIELSQLVAAEVPPLTFSGSPVTLVSNESFVQFSTNQGATGTQFLASGAQLAGGTKATINYTPAGNVNVGSPSAAFSNIPPAIITGTTLIKT
jgi:hypothetical protein